MVPEFMVVCASAVPALVSEYAKWRRFRENEPDAVARRALKEASRIQERCWEAVRCPEPGLARQMLSECTLDLLNVLPAMPHEAAFLLLNQRDLCLEAVRDPGGAGQGPGPRHRRA